MQQKTAGGEANPGALKTKPAREASEPEQRDLRSILIVDDHAIIRSGLQNAIKEQLGEMRFGETESLEQARNALKPGNSWDLVTLDLGLQTGNGMELLEEFGTSKKLKFLVVTQYPAEEYAVKTFQFGAWGYFCKTGSSDEMIRAVDQVLNGKRYITEDVAIQLATEASSRSRADVLPHELLSPRERQLLKLTALGKKQKEIAGQVNLSIKTVNTYHKTLMRKMKMHTDVELTRYALRHKLVTLDQRANKTG